ncbi:MAG: pyruvate kinase [Crocosphaera sp.]|nr:pyruvate kinase [Crocosphaera sp.]
MKLLNHRTKIVATIGPASSSREILINMINAGMNVARLNFSHGSYDDHQKIVALLRSISNELETPITLLQDLQGPKIRIGQLPDGQISLIDAETVTLVPIADYNYQSSTVGIDYPYLAEEAEIGSQILLDDGLLQLQIQEIKGNAVICKIIEGGILKSRKGVNLPSLDLRLPSLTEKDKKDLEFGLSQGIDWVSLSFVRKADDIRNIKNLLVEKGYKDVPVIAKIEKPQAVENLEEIVNECDGLMVARGDLGVEMSPERVPILQKKIIKLCNFRGKPVITATQMLESMINNPRPTRAEASDVANAIIDGTDAVMLSGESAIGKYPIKAVQMLAKIAQEVEKDVTFPNSPPADTDETRALSEALNIVDQILDLRYIVTFTTSGYTSLLASKERPSVPVIAITPNVKVYHRLNLIWGVIPVLINETVDSFEALVNQAETCLKERQFVLPGDQILIMAGIPTQTIKGTNFIKIHRISA